MRHHLNILKRKIFIYVQCVVKNYLKKEQMELENVFLWSNIY